MMTEGEELEYAAEGRSLARQLNFVFGARGWGGGLNFFEILLTLKRLLLGVVSKSILEHLHEKQAVKPISGNISKTMYSVYQISVRRDRSVNAVYVEK